MIDDDLIGGDGETGEGDSGRGEDSAADNTRPNSDNPTNTDLIDSGTPCLSCGAPIVGVFCVSCGQKNDDLRRSSAILARDFLEDTFSFDSRMWRTLGMLAVAPGVVPANYAHGRRSRYTPPVRLFLVVSFLFFMILNFTQTLFVAIEIKEEVISDEVKESISDIVKDAQVDAGTNSIDCGLSANLRFFVRAKEIETNQALWADCVDQVRAAASSINNQSDEDGETLMRDVDVETSQALLERLLTGANMAVESPRTLNAAFNNWIPRVMFFMTPILALILGMFIRGRDALFFDHLILSLYSHAVGFAVVGLAIIAVQAGTPMTGLAAGIALFVYFIVAMKRAYGRGWVKTIYTGVMASFLYQLILMIAVVAVVTQVVLQV